MVAKNACVVPTVVIIPVTTRFEIFETKNRYFAIYQSRGHPLPPWKIDFYRPRT